MGTVGVLIFDAACYMQSFSKGSNSVSQMRVLL